MHGHDRVTCRCMILPDCRAANDRFWALIRDGLRARGHCRARRSDAGHARFHGRIGCARSDLVADLRLSVSGACCMAQVTLIGTPDFGVGRLPAGILPIGLRGARGRSARRSWPIFKDARLPITKRCRNRAGRHRRTMRQAWGFTLRKRCKPAAMRCLRRRCWQGGADIAAIDAVTWRLAAAQ